MRPQPLIAVADVEASSRWYQRLLDCKSDHGGPEYEQLVRDGEMIMQLHHWEDEDHPNLGDPDAAPHGYGVLLWFQTDDFKAAVARVRALKAEIVQGRRGQSQFAAARDLAARPRRVYRRHRRPARRPRTLSRLPQRERATLNASNWTTLSASVAMPTAPAAANAPSSTSKRFVLSRKISKRPPAARTRI
jgi:hypothetical protein